MKLDLVNSVCAFRAFEKNHCAHCRADPAFRDRLAAAFNLPSSGIEQCPFGVTSRPDQTITPLHGSVIVPDRVVCLSLETRDDRWAAFTESCLRSKYLSSWTIERYRARPPREMAVPDFWTQWPSFYATGADHQRINEQSQVAGHQSIMVFEDDAIIQECFDDGYEAACRSLPADWMGLWLTTDFHHRMPERVTDSLYRSASQASLHAFMLSGRGMRRVWSHVLAHPHQVIDGAVEDLMSSEPHFYSVAQNAVIQVGDRSAGVRTDYKIRVGDVG